MPGAQLLDEGVRAVMGTHAWISTPSMSVSQESIGLCSAINGFPAAGSGYAPPRTAWPGTGGCRTGAVRRR